MIDMFGRSPIRPIQRHMEKAFACVEVLRPFYQASVSQDWDTANELHHKINDLEQDADNLKRDVRTHLPKGLFLPVPRVDLLELLKEQESLPDIAQDISGIMLGRHMQFPDSICVSIKDFLNRCIAAAKKATETIDELDQLLETGFRGRETTIVFSMLSDLDEIEHKTDTMQITIRRKLFQLEKQLPPIDVIFMYKIIELMGSIADHAQKVGNRLQILMAH